MATWRAWQQDIRRAEVESGGGRRLEERRRFNAALAAAARGGGGAAPLPSCRSVHPRYRKAERRPPGATAARTPARCVRKRDGKVFALPRLFSRAQCDAMGRRRGGFTARASCAAFR